MTKSLEIEDMGAMLLGAEEKPSQSCSHDSSLVKVSSSWKLPAQPGRFRVFVMDGVHHLFMCEADQRPTKVLQLTSQSSEIGPGINMHQRVLDAVAVCIPVLF